MKNKPKKKSEKKPVKVLILNQDVVRKKLRQKKFDDVSLSSWGHLDEFVQFITSFGLFVMLGQPGLTTGHSGIPVCMLATPAFAKPIFGIRFDDNIRYLFNDHHVLRLPGFNLKQIEQRCSGRTGEDGSKPVHPDTLRNFLKSLGYRETTGLMMKVVRALFKPGLIRGHNFVTDTKIILEVLHRWW
ncbi:MAG: hypothetical protein B6245_21425 [Desulfobacteraceae bacterium 4572_88]|nr:MAG: hypothetical protein B6245_21425 [Desulfobacteraceae bacterium 4572_88]